MDEKSAATSYTYSILFISSYHPNFPTFFQQVDGLHSVLNSPNIKLDIEFMDSKRFNQQQLEGIFHANLKHKLQTLPKYDLIITADDAATHFAINHHSELFKDIPIVFFGVNDIEFARQLERNHQATGIIEQTSVDGTIRLIDRLLDSHELVIITDDSVTARSDMQQVKQQLQEIQFTDYEILSLADYSFEELLSEVKHIRYPASILLISIYRDRNGQVLDFNQALSLLYQSSNVPIFSLWHHGLGQGVIGGKLLSHHTQARQAAQLALTILDGTPVKNIPIQPSPTEYFVDYKELKRFGFSTDALPTNTQIINEHNPLHKRYRKYIAVSLALLFVASFIIAGLIARMLMRRSYEHKILQLNEELETKVKLRTIALEQAHDKVAQILRLRDSMLNNSLVCIILTRQQRIEWINNYAETLFGFKKSEVIGQALSLLYLHEDDYIRSNLDSTPLLNHGQQYQAEFPFRCKNKTLIWGIISSTPIYPDNLDEGILHIIVDITARKQAEEQLKLLNLQLENQATTDHLTGISNRRHISTLITHEINKANRYLQPFSIIMLDIDHFKQLNDTYGHNTGDQVLKKIASTIDQSCRQADTVARWGGEEFLILCPLTTLEEAKKLSELLRKRIENGSYDIDHSVTASFGVAAHERGQTLEIFIQTADQALYKAKEHRNCVRSIELHSATTKS